MNAPEVVRCPLAREVDVFLPFDVVREGPLCGRDDDVREPFFAIRSRERESYH